MYKKVCTGLVSASALIALPLLAAVPASAAPGADPTTLQADLQPVPLNGAEGSGTAMVQVSGDTLTVTINATGLDKTSADGLPAHGQHIHIGGENRCPTAAAASDHNGHQAISVADGKPSYGDIQVSLTTEGDTTPGSALALDRFPTTPDGSESYNRTIQVSAAVARQVANGEGVVVIHGVDYLHNGDYTDLGKSDIDPTKPLEGTAPALCGKLVASQMSTVPTGGAATGGGSSSGIEDKGLLALGAASLFAAAGSLAYRRRLATHTR